MSLIHLPRTPVTAEHEKLAHLLGIAAADLADCQQRLFEITMASREEAPDLRIEPIVKALGAEKAIALVRRADLRSVAARAIAYRRFLDGEHPLLTKSELGMHLQTASRRIREARDRVRNTGDMPDSQDVNPWLRKHLFACLPSPIADDHADRHVVFLDDDEVPVIPDLRNPEIERARDMLTAIKADVCSQMGATIAGRGCSPRGIFVEGLRMHGQRELVLFALDEEARTADLDEPPRKGQAYPKRLNLSGPHTTCPGLRALLRVVAHCEAELKRPTYTRIAEFLVAPDGSIRFPDYWHLIATPGAEADWERARREFVESRGVYDHRVARFGGAARRLLELARVGSAGQSRPSARRPEGAPSVVQGSALLPRGYGGGWPGLLLSCTSTGEVSLEVEGSRRILTPTDLELASRKNGQPTTPWIYLRRLIRGDAVAAASRPARNLRRSTTPRGSDYKDASRLRLALVNTFGLPGDPLPYKRGQGWVPAFKVRAD